MGRGDEYDMAAGDEDEAKAETEVIEDDTLSMQLSNPSDQVALNTDERNNNLQMSRYARAARTILEDIRTPPE